jgi:hypothetical protein
MKLSGSQFFNDYFFGTAKSSNSGIPYQPAVTQIKIPKDQIAKRKIAPVLNLPKAN